jgi:hypothetical protein
MSVVNAAAPGLFVTPALSIARNDSLTDGWCMGAVINALNMIAARRFHVLAQFTTTLNNAGLSSSCFARIHTSPNAQEVEALVICSKATSNTVAGSYQWTVAGTPKNRRYFGGAAGSTVTPNELFVDRQTLIVDAFAGDTVFDLSFSSDVNLRILAVIVYEIPRAQLETSFNFAVAPEVCRAGSPILDRDVARVTDVLWTLYRRQGPHIFCAGASASLHSGTALDTTSSTTFRNVLDASTAGWSANAAGFWSIPKNKGRLATPGVECVFWVRAARTAGAGTGSVRLVSSAGTLVTITGITGAVAMYTGTCTLDSTHDTDLLIVEDAVSVGTTTLQLQACGLYEYKT